ncbi:RNA ligase [Gordonia phage Arri]|uniref:RNA ligase n=1 Tax=Gordonia phage Arri TaxID=2588127 RepID=A0A4Y5TZC3_9CAUD|nr:RNA ligase [Gordonia phage Arri]QDB74797.1 RNA ligase [Gordonia phage Arri]
MTAAGDGGDDHDTDGMIALLPTAEDAKRLAVGDVSVEELHLTLAYLPDVTAFTESTQSAFLAEMARWASRTPRISGEVNGAGNLGGGVAVWLVNAPGLTDRRSGLVDWMESDADEQVEMPAVSHDFDGFLPHITYASGGVTPGDPIPGVYGPVTFDRLRVSLRGKHTDVPLGSTDGISGRQTETPETRSAVA